MTVDECIRAYRSVAEQAFTPKPPNFFKTPKSGRFSATALETAIKQTVKEFCLEPDCVELRQRGKASEKTCTHSNALFRSKSSTKTYVYCYAESVSTLLISL